MNQIVSIDIGGILFVVFLAFRAVWSLSNNASALLSFGKGAFFNDVALRANIATNKMELRLILQMNYCLFIFSKKEKYGKKDSVHFLLRFRGRIFV